MENADRDRYINKEVNRYRRQDGQTDHPKPEVGKTDGQTDRQTDTSGPIYRTHERLLPGISDWSTNF